MRSQRLVATPHPLGPPPCEQYAKAVVIRQSERPFRSNASRRAYRGPVTQASASVTLTVWNLRRQYGPSVAKA